MVKPLLILMIVASGLSSVYAAVEWSTKARGTETFEQARIGGAFPDGLNLELGSGMGKYQDGIVDVTEPPFSADPTGKRDSTIALQKAIDFARNYQLVTFFPPGQYLVSDTLICFQGFYPKAGGKRGPARMYPNVLLGSTAEPKPTIVLAKNSPGFSNPAKPKYVVHFKARALNNAQDEQANISFNQGIQGIDIKILDGNTGAVGLRHRAAQGSFVKDVTVFAHKGKTGMEIGVGSGGLVSDVGVIGGDIGLDIMESQPVPVIRGMHLSGQSSSALVYQGAQSLTVIGARIESVHRGPLVRTFSGSRPLNGQVAFIDSAFEFLNEPGMVFEADTSVYLRNIYLKKTASVFHDRALSHTPSVIDPGLWYNVVEAAYRKDPAPYRGFRFASPVVIDGERLDSGMAKWGEASVTIADDALSRHQYERLPLAGEAEGMVSVKDSPYFAKGDGVHDDTAAIQAAIDDNQSVYFPRGVYRTGDTIRISKPTSIRGLAPHLSILSLRRAKDSTERAPVLEISSSQGETRLEGVSLHVAREYPGLYAMSIRGADNVSISDVAYLTRPIINQAYHGESFPVIEQALIQITKSTNLTINGLYQEDYRDQGVQYRHLLIEDSSGPISIYQCDLEHARGASQFTIRRSENVSVFGLKSEGNAPALELLQSDSISLVGYGGNASALPGESLFLIRDSSDVTMVNLTDSPRVGIKAPKNPHIFGVPVSPEKWNLMDCDNSPCAGLKKLDRPLLFRISASQKRELSGGPAG